MSNKRSSKPLLAPRTLLRPLSNPSTSQSINQSTNQSTSHSKIQAKQRTNTPASSDEYDLTACQSTSRTIDDSSQDSDPPSPQQKHRSSTKPPKQSINQSINQSAKSSNKTSTATKRTNKTLITQTAAQHSLIRPRLPLTKPIHQSIKADFEAVEEIFFEDFDSSTSTSSNSTYVVLKSFSNDVMLAIEEKQADDRAVASFTSTSCSSWDYASTISRLVLPAVFRCEIESISNGKMTMRLYLIDLYSSSGCGIKSGKLIMTDISTDSLHLVAEVSSNEQQHYQSVHQSVHQSINRSFQPRLPTCCFLRAPVNSSYLSLKKDGKVTVSVKKPRSTEQWSLINAFKQLDPSSDESTSHSNQSINQSISHHGLSVIESRFNTIRQRIENERKWLAFLDEFPIKLSTADDMFTAYQARERPPKRQGYNPPYISLVSTTIYQSMATNRASLDAVRSAISIIKLPIRCEIQIERDLTYDDDQASLSSDDEQYNAASSQTSDVDKSEFATPLDL